MSSILSKLSLSLFLLVLIHLPDTSSLQPPRFTKGDTDSIPQVHLPEAEQVHTVIGQGSESETLNSRTLEPDKEHPFLSQNEDDSASIIQDPGSDTILPDEDETTENQEISGDLSVSTTDTANDDNFSEEAPYYGSDDLKENDEWVDAQLANHHLHTGNSLGLQGLHLEAIAEWEQAALYKPDSNVPWNNIANSYIGLGKLNEAMQAAEESCKRETDYMSATTLSNVYRALKKYEQAEMILLKGLERSRQTGAMFEHPFWSLALLYYDQGDYLEFLSFALEGWNRTEEEACRIREIFEGCIVSNFTVEMAEKIYHTSMEVAKNAASHRNYTAAIHHFRTAERIAAASSQFALDAGPPRWHLWCIQCELDASAAATAHTILGRNHSTQSAGTASFGDAFPASAAAAAARAEEACGEGVRRCRAEWEDTNARYLRLMPVRVMGCDWRNRAADERDFERVALSPNGSAMLHHTLEFYFECDDGMVCGAGAQPPMHMFGVNTAGPEAVLAMGRIQPLQLAERIERAGPAPAWAHPAWAPALGARLRIGYVSSDLLRDHPVGNMMRAVLPLHDLSRMDVYVFLIHDQQRAAAEWGQTRHLLGEVKLRIMGRGPHVLKLWDERVSVEAADGVNAAGVCVLFDLIGYTADHRQDVFALHPAPVQVHYHGYMGTTGAPWLEGYVGDRHIAPPEFAPWFSEKLLYMPECFLGPSHRLTHPFWGGGSSTRESLAAEGGGPGAAGPGAAAAAAERRARWRVAEGLPARGPVICFFNQHFKIDPGTFQVWMAALRRIDRFLNSTAGRRAWGTASAASAAAGVAAAAAAGEAGEAAAPAQAQATLWLLAGSAVSHRNLRREARAAGFGAPGRVVFARRVRVRGHLRRAGLCDLGVDSPEYNSGATGADTLYAGVPVVHLPGGKAVGRMMSAMLRAARAEAPLIVRDRAEYLRVIVALLGRPGGARRLAGLRRRLAAGVLRAPLFDVARWVADFDQLSRTLWDGFVGSRPGRVFHTIPTRPDDLL